MKLFEGGTDAEQLAKTFIETHVSDSQKADVAAAVARLITYSKTDDADIKGIHQEIIKEDKGLHNILRDALRAAGILPARPDPTRPRRNEAPTVPDYVQFEINLPDDFRTNEVEIVSQKKGEKDVQRYKKTVPIPKSLHGWGKNSPKVVKFIKDITPALQMIVDATDAECDFGPVATDARTLKVQYRNQASSDAIEIPLNAPVPSSMLDLLKLKKPRKELQEIEAKKKGAPEAKVARQARRLRDDLKEIVQRFLITKAVQEVGYSVPAYAMETIDVPTSPVFPKFELQLPRKAGQTDVFIDVGRKKAIKLHTALSPALIKTLQDDAAEAEKFKNAIQPFVLDADNLTFYFRSATVASNVLALECEHMDGATESFSIPLNEALPQWLHDQNQIPGKVLQNIAEGNKAATVVEQEKAIAARKFQRNVKDRIKQIILTRALRETLGYKKDVEEYAPHPVGVPELKTKPPTPGPAPTSGPTPPEPGPADPDTEDEDEATFDLNLPEWLTNLVNDKTAVNIPRGGGKFDTVVFGNKVAELIAEQIAACVRFVSDRFRLAAAKKGGDIFIAAKKGPLKGLSITLEQIKGNMKPAQFKLLMEGKTGDVIEAAQCMMDSAWTQAETSITGVDVAGAPDEKEHTLRSEECWEQLSLITSAINRYFKDAGLEADLKALSAPKPPADAGKATPAAQPGPAAKPAAEPEPDVEKEEPPELNYAPGEEVLILVGEGADRHAERSTYAGLQADQKTVLSQRHNPEGGMDRTPMDAWEFQRVNRNFKKGGSVVWLTDAGQLEVWSVEKARFDRSTKKWVVDIRNPANPSQGKTDVSGWELQELFPAFDTTHKDRAETVRIWRDGKWSEDWMVKGVGSEPGRVLVSKAGEPHDKEYPESTLRQWNPPAYIKERTAEGLTEFEKTFTDAESRLFEAFKAKFEAKFGPATEDRKDWFTFRKRFRDEKILPQRAQAQPR
ncbi:hypothetical protein HZA86_01430 [Candidatus Uhrbacteria bacterium]|nr:hypothetical protein [Candidatus Uhrbacteria bacterium]